jgi:hypothetical protein
MSTEIIYDKQFIKADKFFIPMIFGGSNNCTQFDRSSRGRRERSWFNDSYITEGRRIATREQILARIDAIRAHNVEHYNGQQEEGGWKRDVYDDKSFGHFASMAIGGSTGRTTFGMFKGLYVTGMAKALTVEQLKEEHVGVNIHMYDYNGEYQAKAKEAGIPWLGTVHITDTVHLLETVKLFFETYKDTQMSWYIGFDQYDLERKMKYIRKKYFPTNKGKGSYESVQVDSYYTVVAPNGYYFYKRIKYGYKYSPYPQHKFATEKQAKSFANRLKGKLELTTKLVLGMGWVKIPKINS